MGRFSKAGVCGLLLLGMLWIGAVCGYADGGDFLSRYRQTKRSEIPDYLCEGFSQVVFAQDYLWFGGQEGLYQFDGSEFRKIPYWEGESSSLPVTALYADSQNRLWVGTGEGAACFQDGVASYFRNVPGDVYCFSENPLTGSVLVGTGSGGYQISPQGIVKPADFLPKSPIVSFAWGKDGGYVGVTRDGSLLLGIDGLPEDAQDEINRLTSHAFCQVLYGRDQVYRIGTTGSELLLISQVEGDYEYDLVSTAPISGDRRLYEDAEGRIWVCGEMGVGYFDFYEVFQYLDALEVRENFVSMAQDSAGGYWFLSPTGGILQLSPSLVENAGLAYGLPEETVHALAYYNEMLWIGGENGLYLVDSGGDRVYNDLTQMLKGVEVRCLYADSQGYLWVGTVGEYGVIRCDQSNRCVFFPTKDSGIPGAEICTITEDVSGNILVGTDRGISVVRGSLWLDNMTATADGLPRAPVLALGSSSEGIYAGTQGEGAYLITRDELTVITQTEQGPIPQVTRIVEDPQQGGRWVAAGDQLCFWDENGLRTVRIFQDQQICDLVLAPEGELWVLLRTRIWSFDAQSLLAQGGNTPALQVIRAQEGLFTMVSCPSQSCLTPDGLYIAGENGLSFVSCTEVWENPDWIQAEVSSAEIDGAFVLAPREIQLSSQTQKLTLNLSFPDFSNTGRVTYVCWLEGQDSGPFVIDAAQPASVTYTNLSGGDYVFHLQAFYENGDFASNQVDLPVSLSRERSRGLPGYPAFWMAAAGMMLLLLPICAVVCLLVGKRWGAKESGYTSPSLPSLVRTGEEMASCSQSEGEVQEDLKP